MVNLLFIEDDVVLAKPGVLRTLYDPACDTKAGCSGPPDRDVLAEHLPFSRSGERASAAPSVTPSSTVRRLDGIPLTCAETRQRRESQLRLSQRHYDGHTKRWRRPYRGSRRYRLFTTALGYGGDCAHLLNGVCFVVRGSLKGWLKRFVRSAAYDLSPIG